MANAPTPRVANSSSNLSTGVDSVQARPIDALLDQRLFMLDAEQFDAFTKALDNPSLPGPRLRALMRRTPQWGR